MTALECSRNPLPTGSSSVANPLTPDSLVLVDPISVRPSTPPPSSDEQAGSSPFSRQAHEYALPPSPASTYRSLDLARSVPLPPSLPNSPTTGHLFPSVGEHMIHPDPVLLGGASAVEPSIAKAVPSAAGVQLPATAVDSTSLSNGVPVSLQKKKTLLGFKRSSSKARAVPILSSASADKGTPGGGAKKSTSLMGGLFRTLTGRSSPKPRPTILESKGRPLPASARGPGLGSVPEGGSDKTHIAHLEESANAAKLHNHVATLLVPSNRQARPLSSSFTSPSSLADTANGQPPSPIRNGINTTGPMSPVGSPQKPPQGPNLAGAGKRVVSQPPPGRLHPTPPPFASSQSYDSGKIGKPKLAVSVPPTRQYTKPSPDRGLSGSSPIPIRTSPKQTQTPAASYAAHHSSSSGSDSDEDGDDAGGLTIKKRQRSSSQRTPIDEDEEAGSALSHSISPITPGLPATPPDSAGGHGHFFSSVRGRNGGGARPMSMHFGGNGKQAHYQTQQQQRHANRQSRIPADPHMHTAAEVAAKVADAGKDEEVFFM